MIHVVSGGVFCVFFFFCGVLIFVFIFCLSRLSRREWFLNGNYLIIIVSALIILPLALMRQLGMFFVLPSHFLLFLSPTCSPMHVMSPLPRCCCVYFHVLSWNVKASSLPESAFNYKSSCNVLFTYHCNTGYLGYTSGFSLSCMVFFLISVSLNYRARTKIHTHNMTSCYLY